MQWWRIGAMWGRPPLARVALAFVLCAAVAALVVVLAPRLAPVAGGPVSGGSPPTDAEGVPAPAATPDPATPTPAVSMLATPVATELPPAPTRLDPLPLLPPGEVDPEQVPERRVERATLVVETIAPDGGESVVLAVDWDSGEWVRLRARDAAMTTSTLLSPDGRSLLQYRFEVGTQPWMDVVALATGEQQRIDLGAPWSGEDCWLDQGAWAPDSRHVVATLGCSAGAVLLEVDLAEGTVHQVELVADGYPLENSPSYSPDGRYILWVVEDGREPEWGDPLDDDRWQSVRLVDRTTGTVRVVDGVHPTYGDPWLDGSTVLLWDDWETYPEAFEDDRLGYLWLDARDGSIEAAVPYIGNSAGFVGTGLLVDGLSSVADAPCDADLCIADPTTTDGSPWLRIAEPWVAGPISVARDAFIAP